MNRIFQIILCTFVVTTLELQLLSAKNVEEFIRDAKNPKRERKQRVESILELGKMKSKNARLDLEGIMENDTDKFCREASAMSLGKLGDKKAIPKLKGRLSDKDVNVRMRAAWALGKMGDKSGKKIALETVKGDDATGQLLAAEALGAIGDKDAISQLKENQKDKKVTVRWHSKVAIKNIEMSSMTEQEKIDYLEKILSSNEMNNWSAVELAKIGSDSAIATLKRVAEDEKNNGSFSARKALSKLKEMGRIP